LVKADRIVAQREQIRFKRYWQDFPVKPISNLWTGFGGQSGMVYVVQTNTAIIERCLLMTTDPGDLVLDPTCGSGTTAFVAEQWGRRWITVDTSRVALALARTRIMTARYPYYLLADSPAGRAQEAEITGLPAVSGPTSGDVKQGFVYKRVPHVTLKAIANNEEIDTIYERMHPAIEEALAGLNTALRDNPPPPYEVPEGGRRGQKLDFRRPAGETVTLPSGEEAPAGALLEWEVPFEFPAQWPQAARGPFAAFRAAKRAMQQEIDASIARRADVELLYDQPYEDKQRIRVAGPFTVESLSPHRVLATDEDRPATERAADTAAGPGSYETVILENLRAAGVQNTVKQERLKFDLLEPYASPYLQFAGEYTDAQGSTHRVAVCLGPEHGTVGPGLVKEAAKEAVKGVGFDTLIVCGFAFDPYVSEETKQYGSLTVLPVRMNPDLSMGADLLKKTGAGNLFMVFGEPDLEIKRQSDGRIVVELHGVDVYDPTTGELRSHSTDQVLCWFIDTDYNGESFFVRHAYFTGDDDPYEKLKRALKAEIDPAAWASLYSTTSRPFDRPSTGKIAVKVINEYGDEVLKVYEV
jgi:adenine-specific DNA-methyltransferase